MVDFTAFASALEAKLDHQPEVVASIVARVEETLLAWAAAPSLAAGFAEYLLERTPADPKAIQLWQIEDLFLCYACCRRHAGALGHFQKHLGPVLASALRRLNLSPSLFAEAQQSLESQLLVGDHGAPPLLARYSGLGHLSAWLRVVTARFGQRLLEQEKRLLPLEDEHLASKLDPHHDNPELAQLKHSYQEAFARAFKQAVKLLTPRQINLLRHRYLDGLTVTEIATIYRVHHSTLSRWLQEARQLVLQRTQQTLVAELHLPPEECASILRLLHSQLDLTLSAFFERSPGEASR